MYTEKFLEALQAAQKQVETAISLYPEEDKSSFDSEELRQTLQNLQTLERRARYKSISATA